MGFLMKPGVSGTWQLQNVGMLACVYVLCRLKVNGRWSHRGIAATALGWETRAAEWGEQTYNSFPFHETLHRSWRQRPLSTGKSAKEQRLWWAALPARLFTQGRAAGRPGQSLRLRTKPQGTPRELAPPVAWWAAEAPGADRQATLHSTARSSCTSSL